MHPVELFEVIVAMFVAVLVLHYIAQRLSLPPAVALLIGGGTLAFVPGLPPVELDPELVLVVFLPPLLMDGAWFTALAPFRRHLAGIASLAIGAVLFTTAAVALAAKAVVPELPWAACIALGAIVSPPDAVSARAVLQRVTLPPAGDAARGREPSQRRDRPRPLPLCGRRHADGHVQPR